MDYLTRVKNPNSDPGTSKVKPFTDGLELAYIVRVRKFLGNCHAGPLEEFWARYLVDRIDFTDSRVAEQMLQNGMLHYVGDNPSFQPRDFWLFC